MASADIGTILARLEGVLRAFGWFNNKADHYCTFTVHQLAKAADVPAALAGYFGARPEDFEVRSLADIGRDLRRVFARYLFLFRDPSSGQGGARLADPCQSFSVMTDGGVREVLDELDLMVRSLTATAGWSVWIGLGCEVLREGNFQDDVVLELPDRLCLLHFGVSD